MPLHDVGYRTWRGAKSSLLGRWFVIAKTGVQLAFRSTWLSRTLILALVPAIVAGVWFFLYEQSIVNREYRGLIGGLVVAGGGSQELMQTVARDPASIRHQVWASLMLVFFRYPQAVLLVVLVGIIAPRLIAYDLRNRGYLLYFSRPIGIPGYILGKSVIIWFFISLITTLPALALYLFGVSLSPDVNVVLETWDIPVRIVVASIVLMIPVASVALACSALTVETRYALFSWFAIWILGWVSYSVLRVGEIARQVHSNPRLRRGDGPPEFLTAQSNWELLSPFHVLGRAQQYVFGLYPEDQSILWYALLMLTVTVVSLGFVGWRLRSRLSA